MGNRGPAAKLKKGGIAYATGTPKAPAWLDEIAATEYARAAKLMGDALTHADMSVLSTYAQAYADFVRLTAELRTEKEVVKLNNGVLAANPKCNLREAACKRMQSASSKLGFSPVDRARVPASSKAEVDEFDEFVK